MSKNDLSKSEREDDPISDLRSLGVKNQLQLKFRSYLVTLRPGTLLIGRSPHCELAISDASVSRQHARLNVEASRVVLEDLGSANGVFVNGVRIRTPQELHAGDKVQIGTHDFELVSVVDEPTPQPNRYRITADTHSGVDRSTLVEEVNTGSRPRAHSSLTPGTGVAIARTTGSRQVLRGSSVPSAPRISTAPEAVPDSGPSSRRRGSTNPGADSLAAYVAALDESLARGAFAEVEAQLSPILMRIHELILEQHPSRFELAEHVLVSAARLVAATKNPTWINYAVTLYALLQKPLPDVVIGQIHALAQAGVLVNTTALRAYLTGLEAHAARFDETELGQLDRLRLVVNGLRA